ncbi:MAG: YbaB/EbfC family nucleoid-associated protein [Bacteroidota bacterium]|nr:YbaB/EbfC family nucleoid-associated protein [Bacteroidota bacterium]MDP4231964.1 YbaB/EbfC family nucleoid-associated protein [Bacteroidota bacterium]MDP4241329.1 YbaB/EbfC family nucleoid-associated protein [Bacteroidota bacterium]MDP4287250.1 YbaB/EbfC family nucleoid-associated protein [Bacteroidota bacterium]
MSNMLGKLQELQEQMAQAQEEIAQMQASGESGGGVVKATVNGRQQLLKLEIAKEVIDPNEPEMLEDLIVAAVNKAIDRTKEMAEEKMSEAARSLLPPGFPMP